jgi:phosphoenolpyruvate carboxykinase (ATP)
MLGERIARHGSRVWLVNTGWTGGPYGVGSRISLPHTRTIVRTALAGDLDNASFRKDPVFGLDVPTAVGNVPPRLLNPRETWSDPSAYDAAAKKLAAMFRDNFAKYASQVPDAVKNAGPIA